MHMMEHLQRFFEEMDEFVYISDIKTHQLVYMNRRMRASLGYQRPEDYAGKLCYKVLQGSAQPCAFCNNHQLKEGQFLSWVHKNPVFNKRYLIKDSLLTTGTAATGLRLPWMWTLRSCATHLITMLAAKPF